MNSTWKIIRVNDDWEKLVSPTGEVLVEGHKIDAEDVFFVLGILCEFEEVWEEDG